MHACFAFDGAEQFWRHRRGTTDGMAETGDVAPGARHLQQPGKDGGHTREAGDAVLLDDFPESRDQAGRTKAGRWSQQQVAALGEHGEAGADDRIDVEQRQGSQYNTARLEESIAKQDRQLQDVGDFVAVTAAGDLRHSGSAAGAEVGSDVLRRRQWKVRCLRILARQFGTEIEHWQASRRGWQRRRVVARHVTRRIDHEHAHYSGEPS